MHLSPEYRRWREVANLMLTAQWTELRKQKITGNFTCEIVLDKSRRVGTIDADNRIKPVLDMLQSAGVIENDAKADKTSVEWGDVRDCMVTLRAIA